MKPNLTLLKSLAVASVAMSTAACAVETDDPDALARDRGALQGAHADHHAGAAWSHALGTVPAQPARVSTDASNVPGEDGTLPDPSAPVDDHPLPDGSYPGDTPQPEPDGTIPDPHPGYDADGSIDPDAVEPLPDGTTPEPPPPETDPTHDIDPDTQLDPCVAADGTYDTGCP